MSGTGGPSGPVSALPGAQVLLVTSSGAPPHAVVPVLAAAEAQGLRVRAIDLGAVGLGGTSVTDRVRRALLGENAERRLRKELELNPPDVAVVFDPYSAQALTLARDEVQNPAPVVAVVAELDPAAAWSQTDCDRLLAVDEIAAVALAERGVEPDRILVSGPFGELAFWQAGRRDRAAVRQRFGFASGAGAPGHVVLVEVAGMGAELTHQLAMQLSLLDAHERTLFLFDAAGDAEAAAVLRRSVPSLGLRAKLFGVTADAAELWRAADAVIARPSPPTAARAQLLGARLVALVDDSSPGLAAGAAALEARKLALPARGLLLLTTSLEAALKQPPILAGGDDGAATCADVLAVLAADKRAVIDERRAVSTAATRERIRAASAAAGAATRVTAMPGDLEDLGGGGSSGGDAAEPLDAPDIDVAALRAEGKRRLDELTKAMMAAQKAADAARTDAAAARNRKEDDAAAIRRGEVERARMHSLLGEMSTLQQELKELDRVAAAAPRRTSSSSARASSSAGSGAGSSAGGTARSTASVDDMLADLKNKAGSGGSAPRASSSSSSAASSSGSGASAGKSKPKDAGLDDELAALKRKMAQTPKKP